MMFRPVRAVAAPTLERAIDVILASHVPEAVARSLVEHRVIERVAAEVLRETDVEAEVTAFVESERFERLLRQVLTSPALERSLHSPEFQHVLGQILGSPQVRRALTQQSTSVAAEAAAGVRRSTAHADEAVESRVHRALRRPRRAITPAFAGVATRGAALAIDALIVTLVALVGAAAVELVVSLVGHLRPAWLADTLGVASWLLLQVVYFAGFWSAAGQTPGMRVMHVRVVDGANARPGIVRSLVRFVGLVLAIIPCFAGFVPALVDRRRRALPDYLAGTVVVYNDPSPEVDDAPIPGAA